MKHFVVGALLIPVCFLVNAAGQEKKGDAKQDADPLVVASQWKGKLTQRGKIKGNKDIPPEFDTVLVVTKRTDKDFECELREKTGEDSFVTYLCKGKTSPGEKGTLKVEFQSVGVKAANETFIAVPMVPYSATLQGKTLKGTWKFPLDKEDTELEGDFQLERQ